MPVPVETRYAQEFVIRARYLNAPAVDLLDHKKVKGRWIEHLGEFFADPPVLGIYEEQMDGETINKISTFISGMILSIDFSEFPDYANKSSIHKRLFAPIDAHTTSEKSRTCNQCHRDPHTLGYGRGNLTLNDAPPYWEFTPDYVEDPIDRLPQDAWIPFLQEPASGLSTRTYTRPFNLDEQKKILRVGACLTCHSEESEIMQRSLMEFSNLLKIKSKQCIDPFPN